MELELRQLGFGYSENTFLFKDLSFKLGRKTNLSVIGSSGIGKSSLLRVIGGILPTCPEEQLRGSVLLDGKDVHSDALEVAKYRSVGAIGFMFQTAELLPHLNIYENIALPQEITTGRVADDHVLELAELTGLTEDLAKYPRELSGGMRTRAALARTFSTKPSILLLDEPFSALDIVWKARLYRDTNQLCRQYNSHAIIVTHDLIEALLFSPWIIVLLPNGATQLHEVKRWVPDLSHSEAASLYADDFAALEKILIDAQAER